MAKQKEKKATVYIPKNNKDDLTRELTLDVDRWYSVPTGKMVVVPLDVAEMLKRIGYIEDYAEIE